MRYNFTWILIFFIYPITIAAAEEPLFRKATPAVAFRHQLPTGSIPLTWNPELHRRLTVQRPQRFLLDMPLPSGQLQVPLVPVELWTPAATVTDHHGRPLQVARGSFYQYRSRDTLVTLSLFQDRIYGFVVTGGRVYQLSPAAPSGRSETYLLIPEDHLPREAFPEACLTDDHLDPLTQRQMRQLTEKRMQSRAAGSALHLYFELDHVAYLKMNYDEQALTDFFSGLMAQVAALFRAEDIDIKISGLSIWTDPDPYRFDSGTAALADFRNRWDTLEHRFPGDVGFLISRRTNIFGHPPNGGAAFPNILCQRSFAYGYANIQGWYNEAPAYSPAVKLLAHELGHSIGSPHTHHCSWPGGALDNCYCPEGDCPPGPEPAPGGGTIMSYCHLTSGYQASDTDCPLRPGGDNPGIDLSLGFGLLPGNLLRLKLEEAAKEGCLQSYPGACGAPAADQVTVDTIGTTSVGLTVQAAADSIQWRYREADSTGWRALPPQQDAPTFFGGLQSGRTYAFQWRTQCGSDWSPWSDSKLVATLEPCDVPEATLEFSNWHKDGVKLQCHIPAGVILELQYRVAGSTWAPAPEFPATGAVRLKHLLPGSTYQFRIRRHCGPGRFSAWSAPVEYFVPGNDRPQRTGRQQLRTY